MLPHRIYTVLKFIPIMMIGFALPCLSHGGGTGDSSKAASSSSSSSGSSYLPSSSSSSSASCPSTHLATQITNAREIFTSKEVMKLILESKDVIQSIFEFLPNERDRLGIFNKAFYVGAKQVRKTQNTIDLSGQKIFKLKSLIRYLKTFDPKRVEVLNLGWVDREHLWSSIHNLENFINFISKQFPNLRVLKLKGADLREDSIKALKRLKKLEELDLHGCELNLDRLKELDIPDSQLKRLSIDCDRIHPKPRRLPILLKLKNLQEVNFSYRLRQPNVPSGYDVNAFNFLTREGNRLPPGLKGRLGYLYSTRPSDPDLMVEDRAAVMELYQAEAMKWYQAAANEGDVASKTKVGEYYETGKAGIKDFAQARKWYEEAAHQGDMEGQYRLGYAYLYGRLDLKQDFAKAREWLEKSADQGYVHAQFELSRVLYQFYKEKGNESDLDQARMWTKQAAKQGLAEAQNDLGYYYRKGLGGEKNSAEAIRWFEKAADQGFLLAYLNLGYLFQEDKNYTKARKWFRRAARSIFPDNRRNDDNKRYMKQAEDALKALDDVEGASGKDEKVEEDDQEVSVVWTL